MKLINVTLKISWSVWYLLVDKSQNILEIKEKLSLVETEK